MSRMARKRLSKAVQEALQQLGRQGGKSRAKKLTAEQRQAIARKAARARWGAKKRGGS
jgi:hypothetical protein